MDLILSRVHAILRSVFGAFEHADVSVACRKQLFGECVCVLSTEPFLIPSVYMEQLSCCSLAFDSWSLSWRSLASSVSAGARWSRPSS